MIRDITIGQYYPTNSILHKLDPRTKINGTFVFILSLFFVRDFYGYIVSAIFLFGVIKTSKVPVKYILKGLKAIFVILLITVLLNMFLTPGDHILLEVGPLSISDTGLRLAVFMGIRLIFLIMGSSILTLTTSPIQLTDGIERLLTPLSKIKVPAHEIAMMMTIALRFIPILLEETDKIMKAQMARGADFDSGSIIKRSKSLIPLLVPLFVSAFRRADDLAMAMEARCYRGGEGRTKLKELKYNKRDGISYCVLLIYFLMILFL
ncbi:energy-coupling factor transport system permease protein [Natranaerovirga hydrolytica]|uniref:Energy-coupling factor transporter transmembrane protein EcfT n=1 Tax=Natranaerovirga hydrolytica TaxID=680378 RepID=A0A4R1ML19_9FIRM|nr:energy-coupling factor transporter transmembrane component T [Natranaerovirga hydrolytica]TCK93446.1 energy-coupling factor transport system permease protein [Natranaerovirga hydrolytica]